MHQTSGGKDLGINIINSIKGLWEEVGPESKRIFWKHLVWQSGVWKEGSRCWAAGMAPHARDAPTASASDFRVRANRISQFLCKFYFFIFHLANIVSSKEVKTTKGKYKCKWINFKEAACNRRSCQIRLVNYPYLCLKRSAHCFRISGIFFLWVFSNSTNVLD